MGQTGSLIPARIDMEGVAGADFGAYVQLFSDLASSTPFDLTGYTVTLTIATGLVLTTGGHGLVIATPADGTINISIGPTDTATLAAQGSPQHYYIKLVDGGGTISFPLAGSLFIVNP